jgi:hypothetical protein
VAQSLRDYKNIGFVDWNELFERQQPIDYLAIVVGVHASSQARHNTFSVYKAPNKWSIF